MTALLDQFTLHLNRPLPGFIVGGQSFERSKPVTNTVTVARVARDVQHFHFRRRASRQRSALSQGFDGGTHRSLTYSRPHTGIDQVLSDHDAVFPQARL